MNTQRINLYDNMKAFAIILVVMGHINEFSLGGANPLWFHFYDSFHMSIFFFVSGLFLFKKFEFTEDIKQVGKKLWFQYYRRFLQLMLPFTIIGMLYCFASSKSIQSIFNGDELRFWFLPSLAIDILVVYMAYFLFRILNVKNTLVRCFLSVCVWIGCYAITYLFADLKDSHYYMMAIRNLPYLGLGIFYHSVLRIKKYFANESLLAVCFIAFMAFLFFGKNWLQIKWGGIMVIPVLMHIFSLHENSIPLWFTKIGRSTLAIYVFHCFLLPNTPFANCLNENLSCNLIIYLIVSIFIAIPIILICMLLERIIKGNRYLNKMIWFQTTKV